MKYPVALFNLKEVPYNMFPVTGNDGPEPIQLWEYPFMIRSIDGYTDPESKILVNDAGVYSLPHLVNQYNDSIDIHLIHSRLMHSTYCKQFRCYRRHLNPSAMRVLYPHSYDAIIMPDRVHELTDNGIAALFRLAYTLLSDDGVIVCTERINKSKGFFFLDKVFKIIDKYTELKFITPRTNHVVDVAKMIDNVEELSGFFWPIMEERMQVFHGKSYTTCGWILRKKNK